MNDRPESEPTTATLRPPQILRSLVGGFHTAANNIALILLPLALDLLLWFGPHLRVKGLFEPFMVDMFANMRKAYPSSMLESVDMLEQMAKTFLERYNLLGSMSTFPFGVPAQMSSMMPIETPLGSPRIFEINSALVFIGGWLVVTLLGILLASLYFALVARACSRLPGLAQADCGPAGTNRLFGRTGNSLPRLNAGTLAWQTLQMITLVVLLAIVILAIMFPVGIVSVLLSQISSFFGQFLLTLVGFGLIWMLIPLIFTPHGVFLCGQSLLNAMLNSTRVVRYSLPGTGLFLSAVLLLNQLLGSLWISAPETSWMALVGIFGHAFVSTALLAATFVYYRNGLTYVQTLKGLAQRSI